MSVKQDRAAPRTAADLERKYNFGESFDKAMNLAESAKRQADEAKGKADEANKAVNNLDTKLNHKEIFDRLSQGDQGVYRDPETGNYYFGASLIDVEELFAKDIDMTGKFTNTASAFLEPGMQEVETIRKHLLGIETIPSSRLSLYDFDGNGSIGITDIVKARFAALGKSSLANWSGAKKTTVIITIDMSDPDKAIHITGTNMWGREIDSYIGVNFTSIRNPETEQKLDALSVDYIVDQGTSDIWTYVKYNSGIAMCWAEIGKTAINMTPWGNMYDFDMAIPPLTLPFEFATIPHVYADALNVTDGSATAGLWLYNAGEGSTTMTPPFGGVRPNNPGTFYKKFQLFVIGRWK